MKTVQLSLVMLSAIILCSTVELQAQVNTSDWCATEQNAAELRLQNPGLIQEEQNLRQQVRTYIDNQVQNNSNPESSPYIIPVVIHNITHDGGLGYVSKADCEAQLVTLTEDFKRLNASASNTRALFVPYTGSLDIEFRLAHIDPSGNCTEGIVRMEHALSNEPVPRDDVKALSYWDSKKYFNIWVIDNIEVQAGGSFIAGYAQFPSSGINATYGIVVVNHRFGGGETVMTHEMGHCLGLLHTFQSGCGNNCSNSGDWICDTPPVSTSTTSQCIPTQNTCTNDANGPDPYGTNVLDQIENFMSYSSCQNMFSAEQATAMEFYLNSTSTTTGLDQLNTNANRIATGVADPYLPADCAPIADFDYDKKTICEGASVNFSDNSYNATPNGWSWTFTGGTPNSSPLPNPTIVYNAAGVYSVSYQSSSTGGTAASVTKTSIITVNSLTADYIGPIIEGCENTTQFGLDWEIINQAGNGLTWTNNNAASTTGSRSVRIRNYFNSGTDKHDLISPSYDISVATSKILKFKQAYARKTTADNDKLIVYWSVDCGENWALKLPITATTLSTAPDMAGIFVPSSTEWVERTLDLTAVGSSTNVRFKFEFTEGGGNDIYIDDINIGNFGVGIDDLSNIGSFSVYPNPTSSSAQISFNLIKDVKTLSIKVRNAVGQEVSSIINGQSFNAGKYSLKIDEQRSLSSGIYFIEFNADDNIKIEKLIIQ